jgi:energy-coupling factor transporter ATP-binding protein EcfA2
MKNTLNNQATQVKTISHVTQLFNTRINHPRIQQIITELDTLSDLGSENILMVVGPTGVGKSTLATTLENRIRKAHAVQMQEDPGFVPVVRIEARATSEAEFNWKLFLSDVLNALEGYSITPAVAYSVNPITNIVVKPLGRSKDTAAALRIKVEKALKARGVKFLIIDEGGHFTNVTQTKMKRQSDALKSLSNLAGCQIILLGSYDILDVSRLSGQLARRVKEVHFARYRTDLADDKSDFLKFLNHLEQQAAGYFNGLLTENAELLQKNTLGCIGTLMNLLKGFVSRTQKAGEVSQPLLVKSLQTPGQCAAILAEIRAGEERFKHEGYLTLQERGAA